MIFIQKNCLNLNDKSNTFGTCHVLAEKMLKFVITNDETYGTES